MCNLWKPTEGSARNVAAVAKGGDCVGPASRRAPPPTGGPSVGLASSARHGREIRHSCDPPSFLAEARKRAALRTVEVVRTRLLDRSRRHKEGLEEEENCTDKQVDAVQKLLDRVSANYDPPIHDPRRRASDCKLVRNAEENVAKGS